MQSTTIIKHLLSSPIKWDILWSVAATLTNRDCMHHNINQQVEVNLLFGYLYLNTHALILNTRTNGMLASIG